MKKYVQSIALLFAGFALHSLSTAAQSFNFEDPKGVNTISFNLDAPLESIGGTTNGVTGTVLFSLDKPEEISGKIVVDATSIKVPNPVLQEHLHSDGWIDSAKYGEITFETGSITKIQKDGDNLTAHVTGTFTFHGVSKEITAPVKFTYLPGKLKARNRGDVDGDLLVLRSQFEFNRSEFGIKPGQATDKVAEEVVVNFALVGYAVK